MLGWFKSVANRSTLDAVKHEAITPSPAAAGLGIETYMTRSPLTVGREQTLGEAHKLLTEHRIRHLPVVENGRLVGMLSDRDVRLVGSLRSVDVKRVLVDEVMSTEVYTVTPDTPLDVVVSAMADRKLGSAAVAQQHRLVGIFTTVDACRVLAALLRERSGG